MFGRVSECPHLPFGGMPPPLLHRMMRGEVLAQEVPGRGARSGRWTVAHRVGLRVGRDCRLSGVAAAGAARGAKNARKSASHSQVCLTHRRDACPNAQTPETIAQTPQSFWFCWG